MELNILYTNEIKWYNIISKVMGKPDVQAAILCRCAKKIFFLKKKNKLPKITQRK